MRKLLAASERKQQVLIEQMATERRSHESALAEVGELRAVAAEYTALSERHATALELLGEMEEEVETLKRDRPSGP